MLRPQPRLHCRFPSVLEFNSSSPTLLSTSSGDFNSVILFFSFGGRAKSSSLLEILPGSFLRLPLSPSRIAFSSNV